MIAVPKKHDFESRILEAKNWLCEHPQFQRLPREMQVEISGEVLTKVFLRKILREVEFSRNYVSVLFKIELLEFRARQRHFRRGNECISTDSESEAISREPEPIDQVIAMEETEADERRLQEVHRTLAQLLPRWQAVVAKKFRGENLTAAERGVWHRCRQALRRRFLTGPEE